MTSRLVLQEEGSPCGQDFFHHHALDVVLEESGVRAELPQCLIQLCLLCILACAVRQNLDEVPIRDSGEGLRSNEPGLLKQLFWQGALEASALFGQGCALLPSLTVTAELARTADYITSRLR